MNTVKRTTNFRRDKRRILQIDKLRAYYWSGFVQKESKLTSPYELSNFFGGEPKQWKSYIAGTSQPNQETLQNVEGKLPGSLIVFTEGPNDLKLWPSIETNIKDNLLLIVEYHPEKADGLIAKFRLDVLDENVESIDNFVPMSEMTPEYDRRVSELKEMFILSGFDPYFIESFTEIIMEWVEPFRQVFYRKKIEQFEDYTCSSWLTFEVRNKLYRMKHFLDIQSPTVKKKGKRSI